MGAVGRPKKYTKNALRKEVDRYFRSISRMETAKDAFGLEIMNEDGEPVTIRVYAVPPSVSALCLFLGIDRSTWQNYCDRRLHPEFSEITSEVRTRIEAWLEEQLLIREKGVQGIIFNLQNNYGWKQKQEVELGEETRRAAAAAEGLSMKEKLALISAEAEKRAAALAREGEHEG